MATDTREVTFLSCDACGNEVILDNDGVPPGWYTGDVIFHHAGGGDGGSWAACKAAHIKKAVLSAIGIE